MSWDVDYLQTFLVYKLGKRHEVYSKTPTEKQTVRLSGEGGEFKLVDIGFESRHVREIKEGKGRYDNP